MLKIVTVLVGVVLVSGCGLYAAALYLPESHPVSQLVSEAQASVINAALDASGAKTTVQEALESNIGTIASVLGVSLNEASTIVANLDIESWTATSLPSTVSAVSVIDGSSLGIDGSLTLYDDTSYVTVSAYGQTVTFELPESAQDYAAYLALLGQVS